MNTSSAAARPRASIAASVAVGVASFVAVHLSLISPGLSQTAAPVPPTSAVAEKIAKLTVKSRSRELPSEKALRVRNALKHGDLATARQITADVLASSRLQSWRFYPFSDFINGVANAKDPALEERLDAWVAQNGNDAIPLLVRAQFYHDMGWIKRGTRFVGQVQPDHMEAYVGYMRKASRDIDAAIRLDDSNPHSFYLKLRILRGLGTMQDVRSVFEAAVARHPNYYPAYDVVLTMLQPKWGGTIEAMYAFVDHYAGPAGEHSPLKLLYVSLYRNLLGSASTACSSSGGDRQNKAECVASAMQDIVTPELRRNVVAALQLYDHSDKYQFGLALESILSDMFGTGGGEAYSSSILQLAASAMHSNTQLKRDDPGHNDYMVDKMVSHSWYLKGFYDNALTKSQDALNAIELTTFPSEEEKALAVAGIYQQFARIYDKLHQYADTAAYQEAAIGVAGKTSQEFYVCYAYYRLKDYDNALRACDKTIEDEPGNLKARYWRGQIHRDLGHLDAQLTDLTLVAESEDSFRARSAIDISMIHFNRKDVARALEALNRYTYLYDPELSGKSNAAVGYNNRCYAYMELGELKKALDDCTASLKYGNLPDAYRKQEQLIKRLGARGTSL